MRRFLMILVEAIKEAYCHAEASDINRTLLASALGKVGWILPLILCKSLFSVSPYYTAMRGELPQAGWLLMMLVLLVFDVFAIAYKTFQYQVAALLAGTFLWATLGVLIGSVSPHGLWGCPAAPGALIYAIGAVWCAGGVVHRCVRHGGELAAANLMMASSLLQDVNNAPRFLRALGAE